MIEWESRGTMLAFKALDALDPAIRRVFVLGFRIMDNWSDGWTCRMQDFKDGNAQAVKGASRVLPRAVRSLGLKEVPTALIAAISSGETALKPGSGVAVLGQALSTAFGWQWLPRHLTKKAHRKLHSLGSLAERQKEVRGAYSCNRLPAVERVVILDDLCTNGSTYSDIGRAIREKNSDVRLLGIAVGKNERAAFVKERMNLDLNNSHIPDEYGRMWDSK